VVATLNVRGLIPASPISDMISTVFSETLTGSAQVSGGPGRTVHPARVAMMVDDLHSAVGLPLHKQPCADGTYRRRLYGGSRVVTSYRDSAAYAEGRQRWLDHQRNVLFARLQLKTEARRPIADAYDDMGRVGARS
jgi:hypothetical protein